MAHTGWTVTGQEADQADFSPGGQPVTGTVVRFRTTAGNEGSVFVTEGHYDPAQIREAIQVKADLMDAVGAMSAQPAP